MPQGLQKKGKPVAQGYDAVESLVERRGGSKVFKISGRTYKARKYHLTKDQLQKKLDEWHRTGKFASPYVKSILSDFLNSLSNLGVNEVHSRAAVKNEMMRIMSIKTDDKVTNRVRNGKSDWERFEEKDSNSEKPWTMMQRIEATARSLRKTKRANSLFPIGRKLEQMGCCVDIFALRTEEIAGVENRSTLHFRLNTHCAVPLNIHINSLSKVPKVNLNAPTLGPS